MFYNKSVLISDKIKSVILDMDNIILKEILWKGKAEITQFNEVSYMSILLMMIEELRDDLEK